MKWSEEDINSGYKAGAEFAERFTKELLLKISSLKKEGRSEVYVSCFNDGVNDVAGGWISADDEADELENET